MTSHPRTVANQQLLSSFANALINAGYNTFLGPLDDATPLNSISINLEDKQDGLALTAYFLGDLMRLTNSQAAQPGVQEYLDEQDDFLVLYIHFPFTVSPAAFPDLARLMMILNWSAHIGGFGLQEAQNTAYYRVVLPALNSPTSKQVVVETVGSMAHYALSYYDLLNQVSSGAMTLPQAVQALQAAEENQ